MEFIAVISTVCFVTGITVGVIIMAVITTDKISKQKDNH